jgi:hypothetical protein
MTRLATLLAIASTLVAASARAGNDDELFVGNRAAMSAGAVSATVGDSSAIWYNPAGLGAVERVSAGCEHTRSVCTWGAVSISSR